MHAVDTEQGLRRVVMAGRHKAHLPTVTATDNIGERGGRRLDIGFGEGADTDVCNSSSSRPKFSFGAVPLLVAPSRKTSIAASVVI